MDGHGMADEFEDGQVRQPVGQRPGFLPVDFGGFDSLEQGFDFLAGVGIYAAAAAGEFAPDDFELPADDLIILSSMSV